MEANLTNAILFILITVVSVAIALIQSVKRKRRFVHLIEEELIGYDLTLVKSYRPNFYDNIPSFPEKITMGNLITNGGMAMNEYYYRKAILRNRNGQKFVVWVEIKENYRFEYTLRFKPSLDKII